MTEAALPAYEKLGAFYLGREVDPVSDETTERPLLYDSKDLTTHAICVGMTGSGKTGLCVSLLEEAAIDGIPAIVIDPKGDLGNLLLTFPELRPADFRPWVDEATALRQGKTPDEFAASQASLWKKGLAEWGEDGARIGRLREAADFSIYTPGSSAGLPLRVLRSFAAPPPDVREDSDRLGERIEGAVSGLLVLLGLEPDPVQSREHILLASLLDRAWRAGRSLDLAGLIREIQTPPFERLGVLDIETFYPAKDRFALAMRLNQVLASPGFAAWMTGEPLDVGALLRTPAGKPRVSVLSIAHLSEKERMFFVTVLFHEVLAWMRAQPGTSSLRALLYMDEVFGYLPPVAEPPSKRPLLTMLKQARAYGLGVVLATQNPVDLDYKALSNAGTWFLGRLQTDRDRKRVLDGLEGTVAAGGSGLDRADVEKRLAGLEGRRFVMVNAHEDAPAIFHTRWAMSYLRGPLTRGQIAALAAERKAGAAAAAAADPATSVSPGGPAESTRPTLPPDVPEGFLPSSGVAPEGKLVYRPALFGRARLHYVKATAGVDAWEEEARLALLLDEPGTNPWEDSEALETAPADLDAAPETGEGGPAEWAAPPAAAGRAARYRAWAKKLSAHLYRERPLILRKCASLKAWSRPGEPEGDFRGRLADLQREKRDLAVEKLRSRYAKRFGRLEERIRRDEQRVEREQEQHGHQKFQTAVSVGATVLGALFGRKMASAGNVSRATRALRGGSRIAKEKGDIARAAETLEVNRAKRAELEEELQDAIDRLEIDLDPEGLELTEVVVRPRKTDLEIDGVVLAWTPWRRDAGGALHQDFRD